MRRNKALQVIAHLVKWYEEPEFTSPMREWLDHMHRAQEEMRQRWLDIVLPMYEAHKGARPDLDRYK